MSYKFTVYFNDEDIYSTRIWNSSGITDVTRYYGDSAYSEQGHTGTVNFEATPKYGCVIDRWYYRIGSEIYDESIPARESTDNPFVYSGTEDIVIRAAGIYEEPDEPDIPSVYIEKWSWSKSNGTATDTDVQNTYKVYIFPELYSTELFAHRVWNDMVEKVAEIRGAMGWSWDYTYADKDDTKMLYGDYFLYAYQFNSIRNNIETVGETLGIGTISDSRIPHPVYSDDDVLFSYFTTLTDYMNTCIDYLSGA